MNLFATTMLRGAWRLAKVTAATAGVVDDVAELAMRDDDGRVTLTTYKVDEHWWLADERARDLALPASMHQAATAQAAREISADDGTVVIIRASH